MMEHKYLCIDLKTFYASVECAERGLDPFVTNLVVADPSRGNGAICLAITPAMKALGIHNRCRVYEIPPGVNYITALPRMKLYIDYASKIYSIYLRYIAKEDIYPYSIDEMFLDVTTYLNLYKMNEIELAQFLMDQIFLELHICATAGIGTNLFLCKIALDITAKHVSNHIGYLDEESFKRTLWDHLPITDFWQIATGTEARLHKLNLYTMRDIAHANEKMLYDMFGVNAEILIDHSKGIEPVTLDDIKRYKTKSTSISQSQILFSDYTKSNARIVLKEMVEVMSLKLVNQGVVVGSISLGIGYSKDIHSPSGATIKLINHTNVYSELVTPFVDLFDRICLEEFMIRRIGISFGSIQLEMYEQLGLFTDTVKVKKERVVEQTINDLKARYGKNSILKGMNLLDSATMIKRNKLIGGHNSGEDENK